MADLALEIAIDARGVDLVRASQKSRRVNQRKPADPHARGTADASKHHAAWYLDVALGRRREKGLVNHLQVGQGRDEDLVLVGVLAQEIQEVFPELVKTNKEGLLSVNYQGLIPVLINAVKEQQQNLEKVQKEKADLEARIQKLEAVILNQ